MPPPSNLHLAWSRLLLRGLIRAGVRHVVISPGSRSTPLVLAASIDGDVECHTIVDERSAAFFALGQVRSTGHPTALICTSGTAGAHYLPAIIEANESHLPLVAITADRPWDAYNVASPQTIDQIRLFGHHVRQFFDVGLPDASLPALRGVLRVGAQAGYVALGPIPGPVHVNVHFRKPLEPVEVSGREPWQDEVDALLEKDGPIFHNNDLEVPERALDSLANLCLKSRRGLIAWGPSSLPASPARLSAASALGAVTGFPVLAEATSQVRFGQGSEGALICGGFDAFLRSPSAVGSPDLIIEFDSPPVSAAYASWIERHASVPRWIVAADGWHDPFNSADVVVRAPSGSFAKALASRVSALGARPASEWSIQWKSAEAAWWDLANREWSESLLSEVTIPRVLTEALPQSACLIVGNSGPVRDIDSFVPPQSKSLRVFHQRGASGIDGLVSGAAGTRSVVDSAVAVYLGDLSALHDLGGLAIASRARKPLVIVVVQNDGGRIFERLPIGRRPELSGPFAAHFVTSQGLSFEPAAAMFRLRYSRETTRRGLERSLASALEHDGCTLIEAVVPPDDGTARRSRLWRDIVEQLEGRSG